MQKANAYRAFSFANCIPLKIEYMRISSTNYLHQKVCIYISCYFYGTAVANNYSGMTKKDGVCFFSFTQRSMKKWLSQSVILIKV